MKRIIPLILVLALLAGGLLYVRHQDQTQQSQIDSLYREVEPLQKEREKLIEERDKLVEEFRVSLRDPATIQILFRELDEKVFTVVYPLMREHGVTGVLGLSIKEFPDKYHKLTSEQYNRLTMDGWGSCMVFDIDYQRHIDEWLARMKRHLDSADLPMPKTVYFPDGGYNSAEMDAELRSYGINTVVINAEDGHSNVVTPVGGMWVTGAMPWNYTGISNDVEYLSITDRANLCLTITIENLWDSFTKDPFVAMLDSWQDFLVHETAVTPTPSPTPALKVMTGLTEEPEVEPKLWVTSFEKARAAHEKAEEGMNWQLDEHETEVAALESRIAELDAQISEVYKKWNGN